MNYEYKAFWNIMTMGNLSNTRKLCPSTALSNMNPTWTVLSLILGHHSERLVKTNLSHGTGCEVLTPLPMKIIVDILDWFVGTIISGDPAVSISGVVKRGVTSCTVLKTLSYSALEVFV
jgi:hypothetical protein